MDTKQKVVAFGSLIEAIGSILRRANIPEAEALTIASCYQEWKTNEKYEVDEMVFYNGRLWRCEQAHTSQENFAPSEATASLWTPVKYTEEGYEEWRQPTGAHDAYSKGAIVSHNGKLWISTFDGANVWEPGTVSYWEEYKA